MNTTTVAWCVVAFSFRSSVTRIARAIKSRGKRTKSRPNCGHHPKSEIEIDFEEQKAATSDKDKRHLHSSRTHHRFPGTRIRKTLKELKATPGRSAYFCDYEESSEEWRQLKSSTRPPGPKFSPVENLPRLAFKDI